MKALLSTATGGPDTLVLGDIARPTAGKGQIVIDTKACAVNFPDVLIIEDKYQFRPERPFAPGGEVAGLVAEVGEGVTEFKIGDRVLAACGNGGMAEAVAVSVHNAYHLPDGHDFAEGASLLMTYGTSFHALVDRGHIKSGDTLLVLGASGGVGMAAVEIGKALGAKAIAAASTDDKLAICKQHGADATINYSTQDLREAIKAATEGKGPDVIYDPVGGIYAEPAFRSIAWRGRYLVIGFANGEIPKLPLNLPLLKGASLVGVFWGEFAKREPKANLAAMQELMKWMAEGRIKPHISGRYALADTARALEDMAARKVTGKVLILPQK